MIYFNTILFCIFSFYLVAKLGVKFGLVDIPKKRKLHKTLIPYTGGVGISFFMLFYTLTSDIKDPIIIDLMIYSQLVIMIGLYDDKKIMQPVTKIFLLSFPIIIMILNGLNIDYLGTYKFIGYMNLGPYTYIFTTICCLLLTNAVNYSDGIDGHVSYLFISSVLLLLTFVKFSGIESTKLDNFIFFLKLLTLAILVFTFFNHNLFNLPKLFLGDSGSLFLGFFLSFTLIYIYKLGIHPFLLVWSISIFIYDFISTNIIRLIHRKRLFDPAYDHLHHQILKKTNSILYTNLIIVSMNLIFGIIGLIVFKMNFHTYFVFLYIFLFAAFFYWKLNLHKNTKK